MWRVSEWVTEAAALEHPVTTDQGLKDLASMLPNGSRTGQLVRYSRNE